MSYIDLIKAFERWLETNYLPSLSQLLWYKLISLFNKCGWSEWITVDNRRLMCIMQIESEKTFIRCRDKLIEAKFFDYRKGKKGSPNQYKINTVNFTVQTTVEMTVNTTVKKTVETTDINRLRQSNKKESKKEKKTFNELIEEYTQNEILRSELKNHLAIRKRRGNLTNRAIELGFDNLNSLTKNIKVEEEKDKEKIKIVQQSISNGWADYFEIKKNKKEGSKYKHEETIPSNLNDLYDNS